MRSSIYEDGNEVYNIKRSMNLTVIVICGLIMVLLSKMCIYNTKSKTHLLKVIIYNLNMKMDIFLL